MKAKTKTPATKEEARPALVPKLRFSEFRGKKGWEKKLVGPYLEDCSGRVPPDTALPVYSSTREGLKRQDAYFDGQVLQNKNEYGVVPPGCLVYRHMSDDGLFKFNINETGGDIAVSKEYPVFTTNGLNPVFLLAKLNEGIDFKHFALSQKAGGTRTRLYFSRLCEWRTLLPSTTEQQKIAECLSSVDELMAAQARKVDALKTHKKGLMQGLFPQETGSENLEVRSEKKSQHSSFSLPNSNFSPRLPRLRFPEFQNAGEWDSKPFEQFVTKSFYGTSSSTSPAGRYPVLRMGNMVDGGLDFTNLVYLDLDADSFESFRLEDGDILLNRTNSPALVGKISLFRLKSECMTASYIVTYRLNKKRIDPSFCNSMLNTPLYQARIRSFAKPSVSQANINPTTFKKDLIVSVPSLPEQQRIAACLSSLDALITAETQKHEALKTHKKGLMQQLFPSPEEVEL